MLLALSVYLLHRIYSCTRNSVTDEIQITEEHLLHPQIHWHSWPKMASSSRLTWQSHQLKTLANVMTFPANSSSCAEASYAVLFCSDLLVHLFQQALPTVSDCLQFYMIVCMSAEEEHVAVSAHSGRPDCLPLTVFFTFHQRNAEVVMQGPGIRGYKFRDTFSFSHSLQVRLGWTRLSLYDSRIMCMHHLMRSLSSHSNFMYIYFK